MLKREEQECMGTSKGGGMQVLERKEGEGNMWCFSVHCILIILSVGFISFFLQCREREREREREENTHTYIHTYIHPAFCFLGR